MESFLIFGLTASLGAMGELAGHERRGSLHWPTRSALIGLMGAAMGIRRSGDFTALDELEITVGIYDSGQPLRDYHTIETVPAAAVKAVNSRPEAMRMARGRTNTTITLRDYRTSPLYGVAVTGPGLEGIAKGLNSPVFTLYLGRKSCPLAAPPGALIVAADRPEDALGKLALPPWRKAARLVSLVVNDPAGERIHDVPADRSRWHYTSRGVRLQPVAKAQP